MSENGRIDVIYDGTVIDDHIRQSVLNDRSSKIDGNASGIDASEYDENTHQHVPNGVSAAALYASVNNDKGTELISCDTVIVDKENYALF